jgi:hypothetical protein
MSCRSKFLYDITIVRRVLVMSIKPSSSSTARLRRRNKREIWVEWWREAGMKEEEVSKPSRASLKLDNSMAPAI